MTKDMKVAVRSIHAMYLKQIEEEKTVRIESKKQDEIKKQREEEVRKQKEQQKMLAERRTVEEKEESLNEAEKEEVNDIDAANEPLSDGTTKLANSISSSAVDQQGVKVTSLMIKIAKANLEKAKTKLQCWTKDRGHLRKYHTMTKSFKEKSYPSISSPPPPLPPPPPPNTKLRHCGLVIHVCIKINIVLFRVGRGR